MVTELWLGEFLSREWPVHNQHLSHSLHGELKANLLFDLWYMSTSGPHVHLQHLVRMNMPISNEDMTVHYTSTLMALIQSALEIKLAPEKTRATRGDLHHAYPHTPLLAALIPLSTATDGHG
ncbi:voltage-dependent R-type calcium channel subunit alpha-1E-like isoform X2 [Suricata suricatta]|uniref:voltage-dependent R-type calcium channel subunit alpha-1E-like isoform X2 n=1 Tax=Suricata suricatta TaxID=37032 RepID=UPI00115600B2|nr:voltage-dependent R-type calcium channel subunit alpha-1E-like isoform X2 [Suricata suricatta]